MSTSGRGVWNRKYRVDEAKSMDILDLQREGVFNKGAGLLWTSTWTRNGEEIASLYYRLESDKTGPAGLRFMYTITYRDTGKTKNYNYLIPVVSTPCNYGGERWWFLCPLIIDDRPCKRKCRIIYRPPMVDLFGCRECHKLTYESRQRHREMFYEGFEKPYKAVKAVEKKLARTKSLEQKVHLIRKYAQATEKIGMFADILTNHKPKIIYREK